MTNDIIERAEAAFNNPLSFGMRALAIELLTALKVARAENERLRSRCQAYGRPCGGLLDD